MKGRNFCPAFIIVSALSLALVWKYAPRVGPCLPASARASIRNVVRTCSGVGSLRVEKDRLPPFLQFLATSAPADSASPSAAAERVDADAPRLRPLADASNAVARAAAPAAAKPGAAPSGEEAETVEKVIEMDPETAKWGVLTRVTPARGLDGEAIGNVRGGRFFLIERRIHENGQLMLVGNFTPKRLPRRVVLPAANLKCFSSLPDVLSDRQRECLRGYYECMGDAEELKKKLIREAAEKSPYYLPAVAALKEFRAKAAEAEKNAVGASEANRQATYDLAPLRLKVQELNQKHKEWKEQHASEMADPEKNPAYRELIRKAKTFALPIRGQVD